MKYAAPSVSVEQYNGSNSAAILEVFNAYVWFEFDVEDLDEGDGVLSFKLIAYPSRPWDRLEELYSLEVGDWLVAEGNWFAVYEDIEFSKKFMVLPA